MSLTIKNFQKCLKLKIDLIQKFEAEQNFLCVNCTFSKLPFYKSPDSINYISSDNNIFPSKKQLKIFNNNNFLEPVDENED